MRKTVIRGWRCSVTQNNATTEIYFVLPDMFFEVELYSCTSCGALFGIDREAERYLGRSFESEKSTLSCPNCSRNLLSSAPYPQTFLRSDGSVGTWSLRRHYPAESEKLEFSVWDPFSEGDHSAS